MNDLIQILRFVHLNKSLMEFVKILEDAHGIEFDIRTLEPTRIVDEKKYMMTILQFSSG